jgi:hypothetical protein
LERVGELLTGISAIGEDVAQPGGKIASFDEDSRCPIAVMVDVES